MNKPRFTALLLGFMLCFSVGCNKNPSTSTGGGNGEETMREMTNHAVFDAVSLPDTLWQAPEIVRAPEEDREEDERIKSYYMRSDYNGQESYAFAYLGVPDGASEQNKKPAVLLIHGGAGSAYWHWVRNWVQRGYVALALDLEGHVPTKTATMDSPYTELYTKSIYPAPTNSNFMDANKPIEQTWMYYAVQTSILGNSLLHSLPYVDSYKIGACGVSWGSVITAIITGYDDRLAFSIPIYCAVGLSNDYGLISDCYKNFPAALVWDNPEGIKKVNTPIYFILPNNDFSMSPLPASRLYEECKNATLTYVDGMLHSQSIAASVAEAYDFANQAISGEQVFIKVKTQPTENATPVEVILPEKCEINRASIYYTVDEPVSAGTWSKRKATANGRVITYSIPDGAKYFYIKIEDDFGKIVTTKIVTL